MDDKILEFAAVVPVMLMGAPGVGKTATVADFAQRIGADLLDVRLSAETPSNFEGKDYIVPDIGELRKAQAWWLKRIDENKAQDVPTVLFFDEYTNAPDALQQLAYSPFNERKLHGVSFDYRLASGAPGLYVFAAGNRVEDETGARDVVHATKTRVFTVNFEITATEWLHWATMNGIHRVVRAFIQANPAALLEKPSTGTACPREWANLSRALTAGIPYREAAHGTVCGAYEAAFCAFYEDSTLCPTIEEIVDGRAKRPSKVHLAAYTAVLVMALREHPQPETVFPMVYRWIATQSAECEITFASYALDMLVDKLVGNAECMAVLRLAAEKVGVM